MLILGLTGSIGMGKTTTANDFRRFGALVHDADAVVHGLLAVGGAAVSPVLRAFPGVEVGNSIDRVKLGKRVFGDLKKLRRLESIIHPMVTEHKRLFIERASRQRAQLVVLDVPLLFETGGDAACDAVVTVSAPKFVQAQRVLARPGMDQNCFDQILDKQLPDAEKCRRSDFVVQTGLGRLKSLRMVRKIITEVSVWNPRRWPPWVAGRKVKLRLDSIL